MGGSHSQLPECHDKHGNGASFIQMLAQFLNHDLCYVIAQDIIPPHGFVHKPSPLWPVDTVPEHGRTRVLPTRTNPPPRPGHADTLRPSDGRVTDQVEKRAKHGKEEGRLAHSAELKDENVGSQDEMLRDKQGDGSTPAQPPEQDQEGTDDEEADAADDSSLDYWEPKPPKVLMDHPESRPLELRSQIQLYATTE